VRRRLPATYFASEPLTPSMLLGPLPTGARELPVSARAFAVPSPLRGEGARRAGEGPEEH
jgi:hypothetical protein